MMGGSDASRILWVVEEGWNVAGSHVAARREQPLGRVTEEDTCRERTSEMNGGIIWQERQLQVVEVSMCAGGRGTGRCRL